MTPPISPSPTDADDLVGLAARVRRRAVSPLELVDDAVARIERLNPVVNAIAVELFEAARAAARAPGSADGPLGGVPFLLKDIGHGFAGVPSTWATTWVADDRPAADSALARRLKRAGLIAVATTTVGELGIPASAESTRFGPTRNPWALDRTAGGSSGGAAAAVAAGMVPAAHANDASGSIRIPASCCGLVGMKPTRGRVTFAPDSDDRSGMATQGFVSRTVRDTAALLDATAGPAAGDLFTPRQASGPYLDEVARPPGRLRVALCSAPPLGVPVAPDCREAADAAGRLLEQLGHDVEEAAPDLPAEAIGRAATTVELAAVAALLDAFEQRLGPATEPLPPTMAELRERGRRITAGQLLAAEAELQAIARRAARLWERYDIWLTPTLAQPPVALGELVVQRTIDEFYAAHEAFTPWASIANWSGEPAVTLPLHQSRDGLPIGVQLTAAHGREDLLLRLAGQVETAAPWSGRRPPLH